MNVKIDRVITEAVFPYRGHTVAAVYIQYSGGGECHEFEVYSGEYHVGLRSDAFRLYRSENGYGNTLDALLDGREYVLQREGGRG